ncbi:unnamed protein product [Closterium sp. NIES-54]
MTASVLFVFNRALPCVRPCIRYLALAVLSSRYPRSLSINRALTEVPSAKILYVDRFGFLVETPLKGQLSRVRLPFPRPAASRKDVKDLIVEMTRQAQGTSGQK